MVLPSNSELARAMVALGAGRKRSPHISWRQKPEGLNILNELRKFLVEHVFPRLQFMRARLASYGRRISKELLLFKKRVLSQRIENTLGEALHE